MAEKLNGIIRASSFPILAVILASCGGGGDGPGKCYSPTGAVCSAVGVPRSFPEPLLSSGLYKGVSNNGRALAILVLDDRSFYTVYSAANNASVAGGVIQGTIRPDAGKFTTTDAVDSTFEGGAQPLAVTGTYGTKQFMDGSILYPSLAQPVLFSANYNENFELTPDMSTIGGNYSGSAAISVGPEPTTFAIGGNGNISGKSASGCTFTGTIQNSSSGRPYAVTLTFGAAPCRFPGATATGISYFDRTSNTLYAAGSVTGQNAGIVAIATKQ